MLRWLFVVAAFVCAGIAFVCYAVPTTVGFNNSIAWIALSLALYFFSKLVSDPVYATWNQRRVVAPGQVVVQ